MLKKTFFKSFLTLLFGIGLFSLFQNCGRGFVSHSTGGGQASLETSSQTTVPIGNIGPIVVSNQDNIVNDTPDLSGTQTGGSSTPTQNTFYNFVAGDRLTCEQTVNDRFGQSFSCIQGGGCGLSCGIPGGSCISANPQHFGLCVLVDANQQIVARTPGSVVQASQPEILRRNFVAGDKTTCERSVLSTLGQAYSCVRGGGCGITCGIPGGSCPSANPQHFGLCAEMDQSGQITRVSSGSSIISAASTPPTSLLYNFVAGDKSTCESSIANRLGISATCTIGGGCGISCGQPSSSCPSANPTVYGACLRK